MYTLAPKSKTRGFTLTELAIVMGVIGTIIGAIWFAASSTNEARRENDAFNEMQTVLQNELNLMQGQNFTQAKNTKITSTMLQTGAIPSTYASSSNSGTCAATNSCLVDQPWSPGNFIVYANPTANPPGKIFRIRFANISSAEACTALINTATACQYGEAGCPLDVVTNLGNYTLNPYVGAGKGGWQGTDGTATVGATATNVTKACQQNTYMGGAGTFNSVDLDFSL